MNRVENVRIVQTYYVPPSAHDARARYEVHVALEDTAPALLLETRDVALYARALDAEGFDRRFDAVWRHGKRANGSRVQVLDSLEAR